MCDGPIHFDSGVRVRRVHGTVLCRTVDRERVSRRSSIQEFCHAAVRAAVWECQCGKDLMREPAFYLAFDNDNDWVRPPSARLL